jgi:hypothetical protein
MFEKMRQTAFAVLLIARADAIPDLKSHSRTLMVFEQKNLEPVVENEFLHLGGVERRSNGAKHKHYTSDETQPNLRHD